MDGEKSLPVVALSACGWFMAEVFGAAGLVGAVTWWIAGDDWALAAALLCAALACRPWAWMTPNDGEEGGPLPS